MKFISSLLRVVQQATQAVQQSAWVFLKDLGHGMLEVSHNTLALLGLSVLALVLFVSGHRELRHTAETKLFGWLQARHEARQDPADLLATALGEPSAINRATAANPKDLSREQAAVAYWISRRYSVAPEPVSRLVREAWHVGDRAAVDPTLILAVMAVESSFNPFAQSSVGAQGLMQVMTKIHNDKYDAFGGNFAAFDPVSNLRVGVQVLKECINKAGSVEGGLRHYVGAANLPSDDGYAAKVLAMQAQLRQVASGKAVPPNITIRVPNLAATPKRAVTPEAEAPADSPADDAADQIALLMDTKN
jgi:Transglycosylase SLT domain